MKAEVALALAGAALVALATTSNCKSFTCEDLANCERPAGTGGNSAGGGGAAPAECSTPADCSGDLGECDESFDCQNDKCVTLYKAGGEPCDQGLGICSGQGHCGVCIYEQGRCDGNTVEVCSAEGQWKKAPEACTGGTPVCSSGKCQAVTQMALGSDHHCALIADGTVRCWGENDVGQLGNGTQGSAATIPVEVMTVIDAEQIAVGAQVSCARRADDSLWCWGKMTIHNDMQDDSHQWLQPTQIAAGVGDFDVGSDALCYIVSSDVVCMGYGLGDEGSDGDYEFNPTRDGGSPLAAPIGIKDALRVAVGDNAICATTTSNAVFCAGENENCGNMVGGEKQVNPAVVAGLTVTSDADIAGGSMVTCVVNRTVPGESRCWGSSSWLLSPTPYGTSEVTGPAVGKNHYCVLHDGQAECMGGCSQGQCGTGMSTFLYDLTPVMANVAEVWAGGNTTCVKKTDGAIECWGDAKTGGTPSATPITLNWSSGS